MAIKLLPDLETQIRIAEAIENLNTPSGDLTNIELEIANIKADYVTKTALDLQLLEKQGIRPNGTDLLVIDGKINSVYIDSLYATDIEVVETVADMLSLPDMKRGDIVIVTSTETTYILKEVPSDQIGNWATFLSKPEVISINGKTGVVVLGISDIENLQTSLNSKLNVSVYENDKQNIPNKTSDLTNDSDFTTTTYVDDKTTIKEQNENIDIKFWTGSQAAYDSISEKDIDTLYFIEEE